MVGKPEIHEGSEGDDRLRRIGLRREDLVYALTGGDAEAGRYQSEDDAKSAAGMVRWARTVALLRRRLRERGWAAEDPQNLPLVVNPSRTITIITTTGDGATGYSYGPLPKTQYSKGSATKATVDTDTNIQLSIMNLPYDELEEMSRIVATEDEQREVWCLLYHHNASTGELRAELSRPASMEPGRQIGEWRERIMLEGITADGHG